MNAEQYMRTNDELRVENKALRHQLSDDRVKSFIEGLFNLLKGVINIVLSNLLKGFVNIILFLLGCCWNLLLIPWNLITFLLKALFWTGLSLIVVVVAVCLACVVNHFGPGLVQKAYDLGPDEALKKVPEILKAIDVYLDRVCDSVRMWLGMT
jgi:hypothetical protein